MMLNMNDGKPAIHSKTSIRDKRAISLVEYILTSNGGVMPDLKSLDSWPNHDGLLELIDDDGIPYATFRAQVKALNQNHIRNLKYRLDDNFLNYCRRLGDELPVIFIGVDLDTSRAYWLHFDKPQLSKLSKSKTFNLLSSQTISDKDTAYLHFWKGIATARQAERAEFQKYLEIRPTIKAAANPALGQSQASFVQIHKYLDELNHLIQVEYPVVHLRYFFGAWKIGFAYDQYTSDQVSYTLYPILPDQNDAQIVEITSSTFDDLTRRGQGFTALFNENPIEKDPQAYAKKSAQLMATETAKNRSLYYFGSDTVSAEVIYYVAKNLSYCIGLDPFRAKPFTYHEVEKAFLHYLPAWVKFAVDYLVTSKGVPDSHLKPPGSKYPSIYDPENIRHNLTLEELQQIDFKTTKFVRTRKINHQEQLGISFRNPQVRVAFEAVIHATSTTKNKSQTLKRPFILALYQNPNAPDKIRQLALENAHIFFKLFLPAMRSVLQLNFPKLADKMMVESMHRQTIQLAVYDASKKPHGTEYEFVIDLYTIKPKLLTLRGLMPQDEIELVESNDLQLQYGKHTLIPDSITYEDKEYEVISCNSRAMSFSGFESNLFDICSEQAKELIETYKPQDS